MSEQTHWYRHFGLQTDPFSGEGDFFFTGARRQEQLQLLAHLCHFGDLALLLIGDKGMGKTRVVEQLIREEEKSLVCARVQPELLAGAKRLLEQISEALPTASWSRSATGGSLTQMLEYFREQASAGRRLQLIIDDAHILSEDALDVLARHFQPLVAAGQLSLLLVAGPGFDLEWRRRVPEPQGFHKIELMPLTAEEVAHYVEARFRAAGWKGQPPLSQAALRGLAVQSKGNPGAIHRLAPALLTGQPPAVSGQSKPKAVKASPAPENAKPVSAKTSNKPRPKISWQWPALIVVLLAGSFGLVWFQYQSGDSSSRTTQSQASRSSEVEPLQEPLVLNWPQPDSPLPWMESEESAPSQESADQEVADGGELAERAEAASGEATLSDAQAVIPDTQEGGRLPASSSEEPSKLPQEQQLPHEPMLQQERPAEVPSAPQAPVQVERKAQEKAKVATPKSRVTSEPSKKASHPAFRDQSWLMARPAGRYTIQLLGSYNEQTARSLIDEQPASEGFWYVKTFRKGQDWFVVLHGEYPNRAAARAAIDKLPASLKKLQPWVRKFQEVQADTKG